MNLSPLTVVLVFAGKCLVLEAIQDFGDSFRGLGQHGLQRHTRLQFAVFAEVHDAVLNHGGDDHIVAGELARFGQ